VAQRKIAPYGSWKSPITADLIASKMIRLAAIALDGEDVTWLEMRPSEGGRYVIVRCTPDGKTADVNPPPFNARTRVHEYGGGSYLVHDGTVYFSNFADQRLYRQSSGRAPEPVSPDAAFRYADGVVDVRRNRIICVREDHTHSDREAVNTVVGLALDGSGRMQVLASGNDFYSTPRLSPDGTRLCWLTWNHPNMPWDGTELWVAGVKPDGSLDKAALVAGGREESIFQPEWSPDGDLYFVSDRTGWWNLYRWRGGAVEPCTKMEAEFGLPQWTFGMRTYGFESAERIICTYIKDGVWHLASLDTATCKLTPMATPYTFIGGLKAGQGRAVFVGASPTDFAAIVRLDLGTGKSEILQRASDMQVDPGYIFAPEAIEFPTEGGLTAHALFYPPKNHDYQGPPGERPPLLVMSHGGPTGAADAALSPGIQYWTSRGIAVVDVNYGGSVGYGREYRERLNGQWGVVDVNDCANAALHLARQGRVDGNRLAIRGGSAGGYTTLAALTFRDTFKAGASHFGVSDLEALAVETHKFESRYLDGLVGPYSERRDLYVARSPLHHAEKLSCPVIFLQGLEDKVVLPNQAERMVEALRNKGIPVAYLPFEGEQHGFRKSENIQRALEAEAYFYSRVFGFDLADDVEPVEIVNL